MYNYIAIRLVVSAMNLILVQTALIYAWSQMHVESYIATISCWLNTSLYSQLLIWITVCVLRRQLSHIYLRLTYLVCVFLYLLLEVIQERQSHSAYQVSETVSRHTMVCVCPRENLFQSRLEVYLYPAPIHPLHIYIMQRAHQIYKVYQQLPNRNGRRIFPLSIVITLHNFS